MTEIAVLGTGVVGASWTLVFARAGHTVAIFDPSQAALDATKAFVETALADRASNAGDSPEDPATILARLRFTTDLADAVRGARYIQESVPERVEVKREFYRALEAVIGAETIVGSSTSGLPASSFTEGLQFAARCLVVHPINPPHLIPLVELVPAPWSDPTAVEAAAQLMRTVGQSPVVLTREVAGFLVNRLQGALLAEAFRLVEDGVCLAADVDRAIKDGLGLRWVFMGPFETIDLNANNGVREYCRNLGPMYHALAREQADPREWSDALVTKVEQEARQVTPAAALPARRAWRDRCLAAIVAAKNRVLADQAG